MTGRGRTTRLGGEAGMTLIEVMITLMVMLIVIGASAQFFVLANGSALAARRQVSALSLAQAQIELVRQKVKQNGFGALAMQTPIPAKAGPDTDASNPTDFITSSGTSWEVQENYDSPGTILATEPLITSASGISAKQTGVPAGSARATVYTFVTQVTDVCQVGLPASVCTAGGVTAAGNLDVRRVVVAVLLDSVGTTKTAGPNTPQYLTTVLTNPVPSAQVNNASGLRIGLNVS
ncbi:MAG: type IV pilus modification PilV family protein [Solirubrobacteraceae bacterium]